MAQDLNAVDKGFDVRALVTGATGFVGGALIGRLLSLSEQAVVAAVHSAPRHALTGVERLCMANLAADTDWRDALVGVDTVYHLAARVHVMHDSAEDPLADFRRINVEGTLNLARQAAEAGVRRFVFVSSVKVNGEATTTGGSFTANDMAAPCDPYGISKWEAEQGLHRLGAQTRLEVVVVRPPLVYGPGVKANFLRMMHWLHRGIPLPFGAIDNRRSLVALDNLVDLLAVCGGHPGAIGQTFMAGDGEDLSTAELLARLGDALGCPARMISVPMPWLHAMFSLVGKRDLAQRLLGSLQVDIGKTRTLLGWTPPVDVTSALRKTASAYNSRVVD